MFALMFSQSCVNKTEDKPYIVEGEIYTIVEEMPEYEGGQEALMAYLQKVNYPDEVKDAEIEGSVFVQFVVDKQGRIGNVEIVRSSMNELLDDAAYSHISNMPEWTKAGRHNGEYVNVKYTVPFQFKLADD